MYSKYLTAYLLTNIIVGIVDKKCQKHIKKNILNSQNSYISSF